MVSACSRGTPPSRSFKKRKAENNINTGDPSPQEPFTRVGPTFALGFCLYIYTYIYIYKRMYQSTCHQRAAGDPPPPEAFRIVGPTFVYAHIHTFIYL